MTQPAIPPPISLTAAKTFLGLQPILLSRALNEITNAIDFRRFEVEVRRHLPQHADDIIANTDTAELLEQFSAAFTAAYAPLCAFCIDWLQDAANGDAAEMEGLDLWQHLTFNIPLQTHGFAITSEEELWDRYPAACYLLMLMELDEEEPPYLQPAAVLPLIESANEVVTRETLERLPQPPIPWTELEAIFQAAGDLDLADTVRWIVSRHGNPFLDYAIEDEMHLTDEHPGIAWDTDELQAVHELWQNAEPILQRIQRASLRLENDPQNELAMMLDAIDHYLQTGDLPYDSTGH